MIKNIIKYALLIMLAFVLSFSILFQFKFENYIKFQKKEYNLLNNRKRISYKPAIIYLVESELYNKKDINKKSLDLLRRNLRFKVYKFSYIKDEYILECFYTREEKENFVKNNLLSH